MTRPTTIISIMTALGFALWVIWMWWPQMDQKVVEKEKPKPQTQTEMAKQAPAENAPAVLTLPAPPAPAPKLTPKVVEAPKPAPVQDVIAKPIAKSEKKIEKPKEKAAAPKKAIQKPKTEPKPKEIAKPKPATKPKEPKVETIEATVVTAKEGRALLRVLEHGKGPLIEIAWPSQSSQRARLYDTFKACFGMENALMDLKGDLYRTAEPRGQRWEINLDKFSGFLREASGQLSRDERSQKNRINQRHERLYGASLIRIFPRNVDASLLGGFNQMLGSDYQKAQSIQATYSLKGQNVYVDNIRMDGKTYSGRIQLMRYNRC